MNSTLTQALPIEGENVSPDSLVFQDLVHQYSADLYRYAFWLSHEKSIAEDLVQETFLRAWRYIHKLKDQSAVKPWLFTILRRENARLYERYRPQFQDIESTDLPDKRTGKSELENWLLRHHVADLPEKYREPLILQVLGGFSCEEIGKMLDLTRGAVMTRVFRAKQQLREVLGEKA